MTLGLSPVPPRSAAPVHIPEDRPVYRVGASHFYADDELFSEGTMIAWNEEPAIDMEPLNDMAREAMRNLLEKLDAEGRKVAEKTGKNYNSMADAFENSLILAKEEGRRVQVIGAQKQVPLMGSKKKGLSRAEKVDLAVTAPILNPGKGKSAVNKSED